MGKTDEELVQETLSGSEAAFSELYDRYIGYAYGLVRNLGLDLGQADDIVQEIFLKVYRGLGRFRQESRFSTWFYRVGVNAVRDFQRKNNIFRRFFTVFDRNREDETARSADEFEDTRWWTDPAEIFQETRRRQCLENAIQNLSDRQREVFVLKVYQRLKLREIADVLGIDEGAVKAHFFRASRRLREQLENEE